MCLLTWQTARGAPWAIPNVGGPDNIPVGAFPLLHKGARRNRSRRNVEARVELMAYATVLFHLEGRGERVADRRGQMLPDEAAALREADLAAALRTCRGEAWSPVRGECLGHQTRTPGQRWRSRSAQSPPSRPQSRRDVHARLQPPSGGVSRLLRPHRPGALLEQPDERVRQEAHARGIEVSGGCGRRRCNRACPYRKPGRLGRVLAGLPKPIAPISSPPGAPVFAASCVLDAFGAAAWSLAAYAQDRTRRLGPLRSAMCTLAISVGGTR